MLIWSSDIKELERHFEYSKDSCLIPGMKFRERISYKNALANPASEPVIITACLGQFTNHFREFL
jgi:hypothetical protein